VENCPDSVDLPGNPSWVRMENLAGRCATLAN